MLCHQTPYPPGHVAVSDLAQDLQHARWNSDGGSRGAIGRNGLASRAFPLPAAGHLGQVPLRRTKATVGAALAGRRRSDVGRVEYRVVRADTSGADVRPLRVLRDGLTPWQGTDAERRRRLGQHRVVAAGAKRTRPGLGGQFSGHGMNVSHQSYGVKG